MAEKVRRCSIKESFGGNLDDVLQSTKGRQWIVC